MYKQNFISNNQICWSFTEEKRCTKILGPAQNFNILENNNLYFPFLVKLCHVLVDFYKNMEHCKLPLSVMCVRTFYKLKLHFQSIHFFWSSHTLFFSCFF